ncbi:hypothetical protein HYR69_12075 [Candidatus Sumerlaeota bacterium]|nr:hypothetical protein [Candidatus Sumerlaeota bacterium]
MDLIRVHEQIMRAESLVRMGALAAGVAHEINNPIGIIIANTEYLKTSVEPGHPMLDDLEAIHRESNRCRDIVQQMLAYANPKPGGITRVDARALNDEVLQFVFPRGHAGSISVVKDYSGAPPHIMADPNLVKQALLNLYINARQSIPEGEAGTITVRVHATKFPAAAIIEIEDTGIGIPSEDLAQVFDPFFSRKPKGTGMGLAMTHRIVDSFGGTITIANAHPRGTIVTMKFPPALDS